MGSNLLIPGIMPDWSGLGLCADSATRYSQLWRRYEREQGAWSAAGVRSWLLRSKSNGSSPHTRKLMYNVAGYGLQAAFGWDRAEVRKLKKELTNVWGCFMPYDAGSADVDRISGESSDD